MTKQAEQLGFWGVKGSGKTSKMIELMSNTNRQIYLDSMGNTHIKGATRLKTLRGVLTHIKKNWHKGYKIVIDVPNGNRKQACMDFMHEFIKVMFRVQKPYYNSKKGIAGFEIDLVIDEAHKFFPLHGLKDEYYLFCEDLFTLGRHYGLNILGGSQRLAQVNTAFRGNCTQQFFFAQGDHNDIEAVRKSTGLKADDIRDIKQFEFLHKSRAFGAEIKKGKTVKY